MDLIQLMMLPVQHVMRYPMILENIAECAKKSGNLKVEAAAEKAEGIMESLVTFINMYAKECSYIESMKALKNTINDFNIDLYKYGNLEYEGDGKVIFSTP